MQDKITLISVSGREDFLDQTIKAAEYSNRKIKFKTKILSNVEFEHEYIECVKIRPLDYQGYSDFCIEEMVDYIDTEYCIIFQSDGFILDTDLWNDEFLNYDYIGAPWPHWKNQDYPIDSNSDVGNGGFCLRSKRMLKAIKKVVNPYYDHRPLEDTLICRVYRKQLEKEGMVFAPADIAAMFSVEHPVIENGFNNQDDINDISTFGFHAKGKNSCYLKLI